MMRDGLQQGWVASFLSADVPCPHGEIIRACCNDVPSKRVTLDPPHRLRVTSHHYHWPRQLPNIPKSDVSVHAGREEQVWVVLAPVTGEEFSSVTVHKCSVVRWSG